MLIHRPSWRHTRVPITLNSLGLYVNLCVKHVLNLGTDVNMQRILSCRKTTAVTQGGTAKSNLTEIAFHFPRFYGLSSPRTQIQLVMCGFPASSASLREVRSKLMRKKKLYPIEFRWIEYLYAISPILRSVWISISRWLFILMLTSAS